MGSVLRGALGRLLGLPAATSAARCERDLRVPMRDGAELLADRWFPASEHGPLLLVRSPYGRRSMFGFLYGRLYAERGFQVLIQSCRGTFGSAGEFTPMVDDAADAEDTVSWLRAQPWFEGAFATVGASYLCFAQWALSSARPPELRAMVADVGPHEFASAIYPGGAFALDTALGFAAQVSGKERSAVTTILSHAWSQRRMRRAYEELPLLESTRRALGTRVEFLEAWLEHDAPADPYWARMDHSGALSSVDAAVLLRGGWYDLFASSTISQYEQLRARGLRPYLTMGPWTHGEFGMRAWRSLLPEALVWLRRHLGGESGPPLRARPVRVFVLGADEWREYEDWPPPGLRERIWYLAQPGELRSSPPGASAVDRYRYDPADPTPSVGGPLLLFGAGPKDNRELEGRSDVLTYTTPPLGETLTIFGRPTVELDLGTTAPSTDVFARLCDVSPRGRSTNVCDGLVRVEPDRARDGTGSCRVQLSLSPTACQLRAGHRLRIQVSSGAHPRFARNLGTAEPMASAVRLEAADQEVRLDADRPSLLRLLSE